MDVSAAADDCVTIPQDFLSVCHSHLVIQELYREEHGKGRNRTRYHCLELLPEDGCIRLDSSDHIYHASSLNVSLLLGSFYLSAGGAIRGFRSPIVVAFPILATA